MESFESEITSETFALSRRLSSRTRAKTSLRLKYEAETQVLKKEIGELEELRIKLGFSRRKICQILRVDPSAWTRWTSEQSDAPPHIYQALKWYMDSKGYALAKIDQHLNELTTENSVLQRDLKAIQTQLFRFRRFFYALLAVLGAITPTAVGWMLLRGP